MTITSVTSSAPAVTAAKPAKALGQSDFIRLMTTQMQMQDPLEPVDNKEMIAQMAQFSSLAGIDQINQTLQSISAQLSAVLAAQEALVPPTSNP